uniref:Uncharacterized protein n=1 Tax=Dinoroseobacter phage vB_DshS_R26L TaxID=3161158 RepID=A0AAU7VG84_9CAUD
MPVHNEYFQATVERDFFQFMCGEMLGRGQYRDVYVFEPDPRFVLKFETGASSFSNVREWDVWQDAQHMGKEVSDWLAPCVAISPCGTVLQQRRTRPAKTFPDKLPAWMTDTKRGNFGMLGRRFVAHDYGNHLICNAGMTKRLVKAKWWE